jgi:hypothetical protein
MEIELFFNVQRHFASNTNIALLYLAMCKFMFCQNTGGFEHLVANVTLL